MSVKKHISAESHGGVLVLDRHFIPKGVTPLTRAMLKIGLEDSPYTVELWEEKPLGGTNGQVHRKPSVIRLKYDLNLDGRKYRTANSRKDIYLRDKYTCQYCSTVLPAKELTLDHVFPQSRGGTSEATNLVTACKKCNGRKRDRTPEEARMPLINPLVVYQVGLHRVELCHYAERRPEWTKYLFMDSEGDPRFVNVA
jgi:5-methylcytosine-specific restriction endonuclease McrA